MDRLWKAYREHTELAPVVQAFGRGVMHHGYIISGARGLGKLAVACGLAAERIAGVSSQETGVSSQGVIGRILNGGMMDVLVYRDTGVALKIEDVREISRKVAQTAPSGYRFVIIEHIERMTVEASNAFLKTLEEPTPETVFVMTTNTYEGLLPTITSRSQVVNVLPMGREEMERYMNAIAPDRPTDVDQLAYGRPGVAQMLVEDEELLALYRRLYGYIQKLGQDPVALEEVVAVMEQLLGEEDGLLLFLELYSYHLRETVLQCVRTGQPCSPLLRRQLEQIGDVRLQIQQNVNKRLVLEHFLIHV